MEFAMRRKTARRGGMTRKKLVRYAPGTIASIKKVLGNAARKTVTRKTASKVVQYRKKKQELNRQAPQMSLGGAGTFSMWGASHRPSPRVQAIKKVGNSNVYLHNYPDQVKVSEGFQGILVAGFQTLPQLKEIAAAITTTPGATSPPTQYVLESHVGEFILSNSTIATQYLDIYDIVRKRDASLDVGTENPLTAWRNGLQSQQATNDPASYLQIGSLPTDSRLFKDYFRVVKRTHVALSGGATHRHMVRLKSNKLLDTAVLSRASGDLAGITVYTMIVAYGQPASIPGEVPTITSASGTVDSVLTCRSKYTWANDRTNNFIYQDNLVSLAGEYVISPFSVVPNASA